MTLPHSPKNFFSKQSTEYAKYRPHYPPALFKFLASVTPGKERVWDCATGNGQAALDLAEIFDQVLATDASEAQIRNAVSHPKVRYSVAPAEKTDIESQSIDLVTVAQAIHWLDHDSFYREVRRVLKPQGVLAFWCYGHNRKVDSTIGPLYQKYAELVNPFWAPQIQYIWAELKTIPFPFKEMESLPFTLECDWNLEAFMGYLWSWSATQKYIEEKGVNPLEGLQEELKALWGAPETRHKMSWPIYLRAGRI